MRMTVTVGRRQHRGKATTARGTTGHTGAEANGGDDMNDKRYPYRAMLQADIPR